MNKNILVTTNLCISKTVEVEAEDKEYNEEELQDLFIKKANTFPMIIDFMQRVLEDEINDLKDMLEFDEYADKDAVEDAIEQYQNVQEELSSWYIDEESYIKEEQPQV